MNSLLSREEVSLSIHKEVAFFDLGGYGLDPEKVSPSIWDAIPANIH